MRGLELMFVGRYDHSIDEKGRMTIPARFREALEAGAYITQGFDQNLIILTSPDFDKLTQIVSRMSLTDPAARQLRRLFFANADQLEVDRSGRILIPQFLRQVAHLENNVLVVGAGEYLEVWSAELWEKQQALLQDAEANSQKFATLDLSLR
jgi:MraZ protein